MNEMVLTEAAYQAIDALMIAKLISETDRKEIMKVLTRSLVLHQRQEQK